jgi:hypothetical protein
MVAPSKRSRWFRRLSAKGLDQGSLFGNSHNHGGGDFRKEE